MWSSLNASIFQLSRTAGIRRGDRATRPAVDVADAQCVPHRQEFVPGVREEDRRVRARLVEDDPFRVVFLVRIADLDHDLLRAARVDVRVRVDDLHVHRIAPEPVDLLVLAVRIGERHDRGLLRLDVRRGELEVVLVVRIEVVGHEHVAHGQRLEPEVLQDRVQVELEDARVRPRLLRVERHRRDPVRVDRVEPDDVPRALVLRRVLDVVAAVPRAPLTVRIPVSAEKRLPVYRPRNAVVCPQPETLPA